MLSLEHVKKPATLPKAKGKQVRFLEKFWDTIGKHKGYFENIGGFQEAYACNPEIKEHGFPTEHSAVKATSVLALCFQLIDNPLSGEKQLLCEYQKGDTVAHAGLFLGGHNVHVDKARALPYPVRNDMMRLSHTLLWMQQPKWSTTCSSKAGLVVLMLKFCLIHSLASLVTCQICQEEGIKTDQRQELSFR